MHKSVNKKAEYNRSKKVLFRIITLTFPLLLLMLLEGSLRLFSYGDKLNLFIPNPRDGYEEYMIVNPVVGKKYFQQFEYDAPPNDIFLRKKPEETFRIFVMGSSTVVGFPYGYNLMFSRILHQRLEEVYPNRQIEIVNTAITAINSFTLLDYGGEIARQNPDAVLIYAGHNEFYGAFGAGSNESMSKSPALTRVHLFMMDFRFYQLLRNLTQGVFRKVGADSNRAHGTLMKRIVGKQSISMDSETYHLAMLRYRQNMEKLIGTFQRKNIPVFLSEVISNVKDLEPLSASSSGKEDGAMKVFKRATLAYEQGNYNESDQLFYEAKDLDGIRFRASEEVNRIITELSKESGAYLVPMIQQFQSFSQHGIIGNKLLTEHVHPNIEGNFIMADAFFSEIVNSEILGQADKTLAHTLEYQKRNWGYTALDSLRAHHLVTNLMRYWPFVPIDSEGSDYRLSYRPQSIIDSIAFRTFVDPEVYLTDARLELAKKYDAAGKPEAALAEYEAILRTNPYLGVNYRDAATLLIRLGDLPRALAYFKKSLIYEESFFASYRMGEIYLIKADYANSRKSFEKAFASTQDNAEKIKTLGKIYMACTYGGQEKDARAIAEKLRAYNADQYLKIPPKSYTYLQYIPYKTRGAIERALSSIREGNLEDARIILEQSLEVFDSHIARRYLGETCLALGRSQEAWQHFRQVYDEFRFDPAFLKIYKQLQNNSTR